MALKSGDVDYSLSRVAVAAALVFFFVNLACVFHIRGVADAEGYVLNTSRLIPVNTFEDDGSINLYASLGYSRLHESKFSYYFNIGGPFLHLGTVAMALGQELGLVKRFESPRLYWNYPEELLQAWKLFGLYKLFGFLMFLPVVVYWIGNNHISRNAGNIATVLVAAMPFIPGFELRMKVDSPAMLLGLVSLLFQIQYAKQGRNSHAYLAVVSLGVSLSMKFLMLPAVATMALAFCLGARARGERLLGAASLGRLTGMSAVFIAVFFAANPRFLVGIGVMVADYGKALAQVAPVASRFELFEALWFRLTHFGPLMGWSVNLIVLPSLLLCTFQSVLRIGGNRTALRFLLLFFWLDLFYLYAFVGSVGVRDITYYFYAASVVLCLMVAAALDQCIEWAGRAGRHAGTAAWAACFVIAAGAFHQQWKTLEALFAPSNRQQALAWIDTNLTPNRGVGVLLEPGGVPVNSLYRVDPFRHWVVPVGADARLLQDMRPDALLRLEAKAQSEVQSPHGYGLAADFAVASDLSGNKRRDLYQEEAYQVFERLGPPTATMPESLELRLGNHVRADVEPQFNILQFQALPFFPISLEMLRKQDDTVVPQDLHTFGRSLRTDSSLAYVHQIDPLCLTLWGVKYLLARTGAESPVQVEVLDSGLYGFEPAWVWGGPGGGQVTCFENRDYRGQAFFVPDAQALFSARRPFSAVFRNRGRIPLSGVLAAPGSAAAAMEIVMDIETDQPLDCILSGGGRKQSVLIAPGFHELRVPYQAEGDLRYEINPVGPAARAVITRLEARPLSIQAAPAVEAWSVSSRQAFARVRAGGPGRVLFSLPWHRYWEAQVDGRSALTQKGPGNTVAVPVSGGGHFVSLRVKG